VPRFVAVLVLLAGAAQAPSARATVPVHFSSDDPGLTVYSRAVSHERLTGADGAGEPPEFERLCEAPCNATLPPTTHEFALAPKGSAPIPAAPAFEIKGDTRFRGDVISRQSTRTAGWWIFGTLGTAGATSTTIGLLQTCVDDQTCQEWTSLAIWSGIAAMTAGVLIGVPKIVVSDEATLTLVPGTTPVPAAGAWLPGRDRASPIGAGATLTAHF
jgi:hypothetical protein